MKIKTQFRLFILCIIAVPLIFGSAIVAFNYYRNPERMFEKEFKRARKPPMPPLSKYDMTNFRDMLSHIPPETEFIVVANHSEILSTNIEDFRDVHSIDDATLFNYIKQTSGRYLYQLEVPVMENTGKEIIVVNRMDREKDRRRKPPQRFFTTLAVFIAIFETVCIAFIIYVSVTISRSITMLEKNTKRISEGELDKPLENPSDKRTANEITNLATHLEKMRIALKSETERRTRFIMGISHDLRTPVAVIKGYTEAIYDGMMTGDAQKQALEIVATKTNQLETMITTLINFVKLDSNEWREQLKRQKIKPVLEEFARSCVSTGDVFKRTTTAEIDLSDETEIPFDEQLLRRALENLLSNAIRYTDVDDRISFTARETATEIVLTIGDTGIGIDEEKVGHIFDLFYRATNSRREEGMGIGLSVVKNIIDTHGWKIDVQSKKGVGTTFTITIPKSDQNSR